MRPRYFGTNLKMYKTAHETAQFLGELTRLFHDKKKEALTLFVIPSSPSLETAAEPCPPTRPDLFSYQTPFIPIPSPSFSP